jgi:large subunit ribosomal protein L6
MSRVGKIPVEIPEEVKVKIEGKTIKVSGPKGELEREIPREVSVSSRDDEVIVEPKSKSKLARSLYGTMRAHIKNMIKGVKEGWTKELEMVGTGYRASVSGNKLVLTIGFSHPVEIEAPEGISFNVEKTNITIEGIDIEKVGEMAAKIRDVRPPEPYKGKGIKYKDEVVSRKPGKAAKGEGTVGTI